LPKQLSEIFGDYTEAVFLPFMLGSDGRPLMERAVELLPKPEDRVVTLTATRWR
jgi:hypothetical protein